MGNHTRFTADIFDANVEQAIADGHPEPSLLRVLARVINDSDKIDILEKFSTYTAAKI